MSAYGRKCSSWSHFCAKCSRQGRQGPQKPLFAVNCWEAHELSPKCLEGEVEAVVSLLQIGPPQLHETLDSWRRAGRYVQYSRVGGDLVIFSLGLKSELDRNTGPRKERQNDRLGEAMLQVVGALGSASQAGERSLVREAWQWQE